MRGPNGAPPVLVPVVVKEFSSAARVMWNVPVPSGILNVASAVRPRMVPLTVSAWPTSVPESEAPLWANENTSDPLALQRPDHGPPAQGARVGVWRGSVPPPW